MEIIIGVIMMGLVAGGLAHKTNEGDKEHEYRMYKLCIESAKSDEAKAKCKE